MKPFILILLTLIITESYSQQFKGKQINIVIENHAIHTDMKSDSLTVEEVKEFFDFSDEFTAGPMRHYDRYLYTKDAIYYRPGVAFLRKPTIYKKVNDGYQKVRI